MDPLSITAEQASELLSKKREAGPSTGRVARKAPARKVPIQKATAKTATAKSSAKKSGAKTSTKPAAKKKK
jgi:DNA topoisomerase-1